MATEKESYINIQTHYKKSDNKPTMGNSNFWLIKYAKI